MPYAAALLPADLDILEFFGSPAQRQALLPYLEPCSLEVDQTLIQEGSAADSMYFILSGEARICRAGLQLGPVSAGHPVGELGLINGRVRTASVQAASPLYAACLSRTAFERLKQEQPALALQLTETLISRLGLQLTDMTDHFGRMIQDRSLPRRVHVQIRLPGQAEPLSVANGTPAQELLPTEVEGQPVVAALVNHKCVSLDTPMMSDCSLAPLTTAQLEGERIYRHSAALLLLEAGYRLYPGMKLSVALSVGGTQWIRVEGAPIPSLAILAQELQGMMEELIRLKKPFQHEWWTLEEAIPFFRDNGRTEALTLAQTSRDSRISLVSCGAFYALSSGPLVPHTGFLRHLSIQAATEGLVMTTARNGLSAQQLEPYARLMQDNIRWLESLQIPAIGHFNQACISGQVSQMIRVAEGFHEKRISQIADQIANRRGQVRIICIAGPSSSGKTTFIKRLSVQLQVNGIKPLNISLDDYYVNRELTPRDAQGEYDFECLEALNTALLAEHLNRLISGQTVATAHYDFPSGTSEPEGGPPLQLGPDNILLLEGIHGLNPDLLDGHVPQEQLFRIFIQPMASLALDEQSRVNPSDLRLLRRIVRDRHSRATHTADSILRWPSVRAGEHKHIFPHVSQADVIFDTSLVYEISVLKVYAERYLLEVPHDSPAYATAYRLQRLIDLFVALYPDHVPPTSILREFIGNSGFDY